MELFFISFGSLFTIINPLGTIPIFVGLMDGKPKKQVINIAFWASVNTLIILLIAFFAGKYLLSFFGISLNTLKVAGGIIITSSGFALLTGTFNRHKGMKRSTREDAFTRSDITITPLAIPMLAGPGAISLLISYNQLYLGGVEIGTIVGALVTVAIITFLLPHSARYIVKALGASGINALSRIIGFIVIAIGVEFILSIVLILLGKT